MLEGSNVAYTQPVAGKLVVDPPPGIPAALTVTFWPVRKRLQLQKRPTRRSQSLGDFEQALADQGHRIAGHPYRVPLSLACFCALSVPRPNESAVAWNGRSIWRKPNRRLTNASP